MRIDFHFHPSYHFLSFPFLLPPVSLSLSLSHPFNVSSFFLLTLLLFGLLVPRPRNYPRLVESLISGRGETEARAIFGDIFRGPGCALPYDAVRHVARPGQRRTRRDAHDVTAGSLVVLPRQKGSFVRSFVSPKHRRRIFNEIKFHPKGGSQPTANPFALFHSTLLRAPFRITFRKQAEALQFFKLSMHREFPFRTQPSTRSKSIRSAVCLDVLRSTGRYFLFPIFLSPSSSFSLDTMSFLFSAATLLHRIFFDTRVSLDISVRLSYYPKGKIRYLRCLNVSPVETSPCVGKRGIDNGTTLLGEENFGNRRLFRLASDERAQLVSKIIIRKLD